jgi:hypothetical protein
MQSCSLLALTKNTVSGIVNLSCIEPNELNMLDKQNPPSGGAKLKQGRKAGMGNLSRRSVLRTSLAAAAVGTLARPYIANAAATTATVWWTQGFAEEEDISFKKIVADYAKASGNTIDHTIIPYAPVRQKIVSAVTSGGVPDMFQNTPAEIIALYA